MQDFGPYSVDPQQVGGLSGAAFANFVGRLLSAEVARAGLTGTTLSITYRENLADGGVDANLRRVHGTTWIPNGDSAWQFKAGDLLPADCAKELTGATEAIAILRAGGVYRLALGEAITADKVRKRRESLEKAAELLNIEVKPGTFEVLNGNDLARWAEEFPSVASSPSIRGIGIAGQTFEQWSKSATHKTTWIPSPARDQQIESLREAIALGDEAGIHVEGVSGLGKTRLVMEALRGQPNEALVLYIPSDDQLTPSVLNYLEDQSRSAVLVIDECDAKRHDTFAAMLQTGTKIRLITISEPSADTPRAAPILRVEPFADDALDQLLTKNRPTLWPEAIRVIVDVAAGNIDLALKCATLLLAHPTMSAGKLIRPEDIRQLIKDELPGGALFLASCALALFSRIGFDGEVSSELATLGIGLGLTEDNLRAAAADLRRKGLLTSQGRYRSVGPHPVAVLLASTGWAEFGSKIPKSLLPKLDEAMLERLFRRATEIGDASLPREVIEEMLGASDVLSSLNSVAAGARGRMLDHLAILSPARVSMRISELLAATSEEDLQRNVGARRPLVRALEKLVWHSSTFEESADSLLRLAMAENETYANNSTGSWVELFSAVLPATAALPAQRLKYLRQTAVNEDSRVKELAIKAAGQAFNANETVMVSGELQGGVVVEPRGGVQTLPELQAYRIGVIDILHDLAHDSDPAVSSAAVHELADAVHVSLADESVRTHLTEVLASLPPKALREVRVKLQSLGSIFDRTGDEAGMAKRIDSIGAALPPETPIDRLWVLSRMPAWDMLDVDIESELRKILAELAPDDAISALIEILSSKISADFSIGKVIAQLDLGSSEMRNFLITEFEHAGSRALIGYLWGREEKSSGSFDRFIDELDGDALTKLLLTTQGPVTTRARERLDSLLEEVSVAQGVRAVFYWLRQDPDRDLLDLHLKRWTEHIGSQDDYNALVDFLPFALHERPVVSAELEALVEEVVSLRRAFPDVGSQEYDWNELAKRQLETDPSALVTLLADLIDADSLTLHPGLGEQSLLEQAIKLAGPTSWIGLMDRLSRRDSWRLSFTARGWLANVVDVETAKEWVGSDATRAQTLASTSAVGDDELTPVAVYLLDEFGDDERVSSVLVGSFISGMWSGNESDRIKRQINQVNGWLKKPSQPHGVKKWCRKLISHLESTLREVEQREQESDW